MRQTNIMYSSYLDIIKFCSLLTIPQLIAYRDSYQRFKTREHLIASEVLKIRLTKGKKKKSQKELNKGLKRISALCGFNKKLILQ